MEFIRFENVIREYQVGRKKIKALNNVSFTVERGKFSIILGPSGSGKSTTLNLLGGMDKTTSGKIMVDNKEISKFNENELTNYRRKQVGFVFQFYNLIPTLTAFENVDLICQLNKNSLPAREALKAVGLEDRMENFPSELSGGELQRVSIARALCKNPKLFLCDEPTGALDSETGKRILMLLQKMSRDYNSAVIAVTHNSKIASIADRVIRLKDGQISSIDDNKSPLAIEEVEW
ncbi:ABC transporter ATP-binding protein [Clostridium felsineum]|uniref:ABC transporter ATP-binding protein n=1 Tax=Clostridium felsineum TaxID=36839 RepID=UPI00214D1A97|nr:ABC transporter ATP-binding protein [Clostridium felsineum]MCR3758492.1 ABC transporter ATP-binding protein [Clostridium felsineum]